MWLIVCNTSRMGAGSSTAASPASVPSASQSAPPAPPASVALSSLQAGTKYTVTTNGGVTVTGTYDGRKNESGMSNANGSNYSFIVDGAEQGYRSTEITHVRLATSGGSRKRRASKRRSAKRHSNKKRRTSRR